MRKAGTYQILGQEKFFIPANLPPKDPPFTLTNEIALRYGEASFSLGRLNEMAQRLPNINRFIKAYVIKEAMLSSAIEGIHTTLYEVLGQDKASGVSSETRLVLNYGKALKLAAEMITSEGMPLVTRVILAAHKALMSLGQDDRAAPGKYRRQSVRVGELIPPPAPQIPDLIKALEFYINEPSELPELIKIGLVHVQFETIHPFLDGNGRIGRLLIVLMLMQMKFLDVPVIYPSYYFKKFHTDYYYLLNRVRTHGDFEGWIDYYLNIVKLSADDAYQRAKEIEQLEKSLIELIQTDEQLTKMRETAYAALAALFASPIISLNQLSNTLDKTYNTANKIIRLFMRLNLVKELSGQKRNKFYGFRPYLDLLEKDYSN